MISTESELKSDVREMTGYPDSVLPVDGLEASIRTAKRHIRVKKSLDQNYDWYDSENVQATEALFWFTCLFSKVQTGELDSQGLQAGAVDANELLAKESDKITTWYRNANSSLKSIKSASIVRSAAPARTGRQYESDSFGEQSSGSSTEVDGTDL